MRKVRNVLSKNLDFVGLHRIRQTSRIDVFLNLTLPNYIYIGIEETTERCVLS